MLLQFEHVYIFTNKFNIIFPYILVIYKIIELQLNLYWPDLIEHSPQYRNYRLGVLTLKLQPMAIFYHTDLLKKIISI